MMGHDPTLSSVLNVVFVIAGLDPAIPDFE
jgi:hypothetical protein